MCSKRNVKSMTPKMKEMEQVTAFLGDVIRELRSGEIDGVVVWVSYEGGEMGFARHRGEMCDPWRLIGYGEVVKRRMIEQLEEE